MNEQSPKSQNFDPEADIAAAIERVVDTQGVSYARASEIVRGSDASDEDDQSLRRTSLSSKKRSRRGGSYVGPQYGEEEGVGTEDGLPHYYNRDPLEMLSDEQLTTNQVGAKAVRAALVASEQQSGTYDDSPLARARRMAREAKKK